MHHAALPTLMFTLLASLLTFPPTTASACATPEEAGFLTVTSPPPSPPPSDFTPWASPEEFSVAQAFNRLYATTYDTTTYAGLKAIIDTRATKMKESWTVRDIRWLQLLVCDSSGSPAVNLLVNSTVVLQVAHPGPWTSPSRGWLPDQPANAKPVDLIKLLSSQGLDPATATFQIMVDSIPMTPTNTLHLRGHDANQTILAFNDNGSTDSGDRDSNEPILLAIHDPEWR